MKTGERWSSWKTRTAMLLLALCVPGCAKDRASVEKALMAQQSVLRNEGVADRYRVGCPDIVEFEVPLHPELSVRHEIGPDGRIEMGEYGKLRIEGQTTAEIAKLIAQETGASPEAVKVQVAEYRCQYVLLFGEVIGWQRSVPYRGQETVLDLLQRVGGITTGAEPKDVYVLRPHLGDNQRPEAFRVDLHAIVLKQDLKTNIRLQPFDQIYVGETRRAQIENALPPWMRPAYQALWNTKPDLATKK